MDTIISFLEKLVHYSAELGIVLAELAGLFGSCYHAAVTP